MKTRLLIIGVFLLGAVNAKAGDLFGGSLKPTPSVTLFGQTISWPIPSLCIGAKAGVLPDASISPDGLNIKIPYLSLEIPFPSLILSLGKEKPTVELKLGAVDKTEHEPKKD